MDLSSEPRRIPFTCQTLLLIAQASVKGPLDKMFLEGGVSVALTPTLEAPTECGVGKGQHRLGLMHTGWACCELLCVLGWLLSGSSKN